MQREAIREADVWIREVEETDPATGEEKREAGRSAATDGQGHLDEPQVGSPTEESQLKLQPPGKQASEVHWQEVADVPVHLQVGAAAVEEKPLRHDDGSGSPPQSPLAGAQMLASQLSVHWQEVVATPLGVAKVKVLQVAL